jgi:hypothetical protein
LSHCAFVCGARSYLARQPAPRKPQDVAAHDCIVLRENQEDVSLTMRSE